MTSTSGRCGSIPGRRDSRPLRSCVRRRAGARGPLLLRRDRDRLPWPGAVSCARSWRDTWHHRAPSPFRMAPKVSRGSFGDGRLRFNRPTPRTGRCSRSHGAELRDRPRADPTDGRLRRSPATLSSEETATLMGLPSAGRARAFFAFWTQQGVHQGSGRRARHSARGLRRVRGPGRPRAADANGLGPRGDRSLVAESASRPPPGFAAAIAIERRLAHVTVAPASHLRSAARRER